MGAGEGTSRDLLWGDRHIFCDQFWQIPVVACQSRKGKIKFISCHHNGWNNFFFVRKRWFWSLLFLGFFSSVPMTLRLAGGLMMASACSDWGEGSVGCLWWALVGSYNSTQWEDHLSCNQKTWTWVLGLCYITWGTLKDSESELGAFSVWVFLKVRKMIGISTFPLCRVGWI